MTCYISIWFDWLCGSMVTDPLSRYVTILGHQVMVGFGTRISVIPVAHVTPSVVRVIVALGTPEVGSLESNIMTSV